MHLGLPFSSSYNRHYTKGVFSFSSDSEVEFVSLVGMSHMVWHTANREGVRVRELAVSCILGRAKNPMKLTQHRGRFEQKH